MGALYSSHVEGQWVELFETHGDGEHVDLDNLPAPNCEVHERKWPPIGKPRRDSRGLRSARMLAGGLAFGPNGTSTVPRPGLSLVFRE